MKNMLLVVILAFMAISCVPADKQEDTGTQLSEQDQRMAWWREARFGLFIHWGLYAQPAGEWKGEQIPGISEWIMARAEIPVAEYEQLAATFNPVNFDPESWARLAKIAGFKYVVFTAKHHSGFCMFHTGTTPFSIEN